MYAFAYIYIHIICEEGVCVHICMYVSMYIYTHTYIHIYTHKHTHTHTHTHTHSQTQTHTHTHTLRMAVRACDGREPGLHQESARSKARRLRRWKRRVHDRGSGTGRPSCCLFLLRTRRALTRVSFLLAHSLCGKCSRHSTSLRVPGDLEHACMHDALGHLFQLCIIVRFGIHCFIFVPSTRMDARKLCR
jgi:hypothetical protein